MSTRAERLNQSREDGIAERAKRRAERSNSNYRQKGEAQRSNVTEATRSQVSNVSDNQASTTPVVAPVANSSSARSAVYRQPTRRRLVGGARTNIRKLLLGAVLLAGAIGAYQGMKGYDSGVSEAEAMERSVPHKKKKMPGWVEAGMALYNLSDSKPFAVDTRTNNIVHKDLPEAAGDCWTDKMVDADFGGKYKEPCSLTTTRKILALQDWSEDELGCKVRVNDCQRQMWDQAKAWFSGAGSKPLSSEQAGHATGDSVDLGIMCTDGQVILGTMDGEPVVYGTKKPKGKLKADKSQKETVKKWLKDNVLFKDELAELSQKPGYNEDKCLEFAYKQVHRLVGASVLGTNTAVEEKAMELGLIPAYACDFGIMLRDGYHHNTRHATTKDVECTEEHRKAYAKASLQQSMGKKVSRKTEAGREKIKNHKILPEDKCTGI